MVDSGRLVENSIIELADHLVNEIKSKKYERGRVCVVGPSPRSALQRLTRAGLNCRVIIVIKINNIFPAPASGMIGQPTEIDSGAVSKARAAGCVKCPGAWG